MKVRKEKDCSLHPNTIIMSYVKYGLGIDRAMDTFQVCLSVVDDQQKVPLVSSACFANNIKGFQSFLKWSDKHSNLSLPLIYLVEATGIYHEPLAWFLFEKNCSVVVVLPNKAKKYKEALGLKSKNDAIDAYGLSRLACEQYLKCWQPVSKNLYKLRVLTRPIEAITAQMTIVQNQLHALSHGMYRIKEVEKLMQGDLLLKRKFDQILKIKGLGVQSLSVIVAETDGFALTENQSQLTSYTGYDVVENQSGNRVGKTKISKKGNGHIRKGPCIFPP